MELKRRIDFWKLLGVVFCLLFLAYVVFVLVPVHAVNYKIDTKVAISSIGLISDVTKLDVENSELNTPDTIVGSYSRSPNKTLLIGHSTTVFRNLKYIKIGDFVSYGNSDYVVDNIRLMNKKDIDMSKLLAPAEHDTIVLMTCAGKETSNRDFTHRLIIEASSI